MVAVLAVAIEEVRQFVSSRCQSSFSLCIDNGDVTSIIYGLWIGFEFTNDARTRKIRAGSDFEVIGASLSEPHIDEFAVEFLYIAIYICK